MLLPRLLLIAIDCSFFGHMYSPRNRNIYLSEIAVLLNFLLWWTKNLQFKYNGHCTHSQTNHSTDMRASRRLLKIILLRWTSKKQWKKTRFYINHRIEWNGSKDMIVFPDVIVECAIDLAESGDSNHYTTTRI